MAAVLAWALVTGAPRSARGEPPDADISTQAKQLFGEGVAATSLAQWDKARTFLLSAWRIQHHWKIAANLGRAEFKSDRLRDAAEHLSFFLDTAPDDVDTKERARAEEMLTQARARVGTVKVTGLLDGAELVVDGVAVGKLPPSGRVFLEPGTRRVEARAEGYTEAGATVEAEAGKEVPLELVLAKVPEPKPLVRVVRVETVRAPQRERNKVVVIAGAAAGVAALGLGVGFMAGSFAEAGKRDAALKVHQCEPHTPTCVAEVVRADHSRVMLANGSFWSFLAAGALGAGTLTYVLMTPSKSKSKVSASVSVGPGSAGATVVVPW
jgi:hypothetical protein